MWPCFVHGVVQLGAAPHSPVFKLHDGGVFPEHGFGTHDLNTHRPFKQVMPSMVPGHACAPQVDTYLYYKKMCVKGLLLRTVHACDMLVSM
jgi:hypothetical protein